ncbi:4-(cytidine 5'-diphospho)-2-C-methyl-D-erythritol kinase [Streptomyces vinaceus]|nr:4-(cytidine 5'-diphospho)-2-C-methyl-D-erythritol kinase [Streptomyces vinaceus]
MSNPGSVTVHAPGKVNVQLVVGGRRTDGFHELANVYMAVSSYDDITVSPADRLRVTVSGPGEEGVPTNDSNLAAQAATLLGKHAGIEPDVHIHIDKRLPVAGGMAGGSADAAGALIACDALWGLGTEQHVLMSLAAELGSDVPFNLLGGTALGVGRGERLTRLPCSGTYHWVFAIAGFGLSTPEVYGAHERRRRQAGLPFSAADMATPQPSAALLEALAQGDIAGLAASISNDLETTAAALRPELTRTLKAGLAAGAMAGMLCGTGATTAFLAADRPGAERIAKRLLASEACTSAFVAHGPVPGPALA